VTSSAGDRIQSLSPRQIWIVLGSLMLGTALSALDTTIVSTALPTITGKLGGFESYAWVGTSYILVSTISTPILGKLGDLFGRRKMILIVIGIFTLGSLLCGLATNMPQLIAARGIQGLGGGGIQALTFAILGELVSPRERGRYMGLYTGIYAASAVVGPLVGGWMIDHFAWQWIFLINVPVAAIAIAAIMKTLHLPFVKRKAKIDFAGAFLLSVSLGALIVALERGRSGWSRPIVPVLLVIALIAFVLFLFNESRVPEPIVPLQLFRNRVFSTGCAMGFVAGAMSFGVQQFLPLQFQDANFVKPTMAGLYLAPLMAGVMIGSTGGGFLTARTGRYKFVPVMGLGLSVIGTVLISQLSLSWGFLVLALPMLAIGVGNGGTFTTTSIATQNAIDPAVLGIGTATLVSFRSLGGSLALAAYGSIFTSTVSSKLQRNLPADALPKGTKVSTLVRAPDEIKALPTAVRDVVAHAITSGTARVFLFAVPLVFAGWLLALSIPELPLRRSN
jgi:EmrB/QacA subfamily drug resistance transporter